MAEKLDFAELERECQAAVAFSEGADCYQRDILQLIGHIRELERDKADWLKANAPGGWIDDLRRASQPGSGEAVSGAEWLALANQAHALKSSRETENESRYRFLRARFTKDCNVSTCSATDARHLALLGRIPILLLQHGTAAQPSEINRERGI